MYTVDTMVEDNDGFYLRPADYIQVIPELTECIRSINES